MAEPGALDYFYGTEAEQYTFYRIPKDEVARDAILKMLPPRVVYVSCDPATLARDVAELCGAGYWLERAQAFDMFPRTSHVETVCLLQR